MERDSTQIRMGTFSTGFGEMECWKRNLIDYWKGAFLSFINLIMIDQYKQELHEFYKKVIKRNVSDIREQLEYFVIWMISMQMSHLN